MGGSKGGIEQQSLLTPEQEQAFSGLLKDFDPSMLTNMFQTSVADPARQQFQEQTLPGIQERFIAGGGSRSGAVNRAGVQAGSNLESSLSGQLATLLAQGQESSDDRRSKLATSKITENIRTAPQESPWMSLLKPVVAGAATAFGGPLGGAAASGVMNVFSKPKT